MQRKSNIEEFVRDVPRVSPDNIDKAKHHELLQSYLEDGLPESTFDVVNAIDELVGRAHLYPDLWLTRAIKEVLRDGEVDLKNIKLLYFLENFYFMSINYISQEQTEELFTEAIGYSLNNPEVAGFLLGVYPEYIEEI